ncbi:MAG TPA: OmpH family outer membrane protein [Terriglobales bacterium]
MLGTSKTHILALALAMSPPFAAASMAQGAAAAPAANPGPVSTKIGIVNIQDAIVGTNEGKKEFDALQAKFSPKQTELKALNDEVDNLKKQFQAQQNALSDEERASRAKTIEAKQKTLQRSYDDAQTEFQQAEQEVVNRIGAKMLTVLEKYAKANGYSVVLDVSNPQTPVLWANQGTIITKELVDAYNTANPSAAPSAKSTGTTRPATTAARPATSATPSATPKKP